MGLFSSKYVTRVGTVTSRVIEDTRLPNAVKTGLTKALFSADGQIVENMLEEMVASVGAKAASMYQYGRDHYSFGLPSGTMLASSDGTGVVTAQIKALFGASTTVAYHQFGPLNNLHFGWKKLCELYAYDSSTNQLGTLTTAKGTPVYLKDMVVVVKEATLAEMGNGSLAQWGTPPNNGYTPERAVIGIGIRAGTPFSVSSTAASDHLEVTYVWQTSTVVVVEGVSLTRQVLNQETLSIPVTGYDEASDYFQVKCTIAGKDGYWLYRMGAGTYPLMDAVFTPHPHADGTYFPIGYFRYNKQNVAGTPDSVECTQAKKLTKYLGMNFLDVAKAIDGNPDIAQVESALLMMAVPAVTTNVLEQRYLYGFFDRMYAEAGSSGITAPGYAAPRISLVIQDTRFKTALSCEAVVKVSKAGVLGPVGTYASGRDSKSITVYGVDAESGVPIESVSSVGYHYYRVQISDAIYDEIEVVDLKMTYFVYGEYTTVGGESDDILLIPLDYAITSGYSLPDKEELYARSLHYIFNSRTVTEVKWYQQGWFSSLMIIVAVVITIVSWGTYGPAVMAYLSAIEAGTVALSAVLIGVLIDYIVPAVLIAIGTKLFVKAVGTDAAIIVAIAAMVVSVGMAMDAGSFASAPWANDLVKLSTNLSKGVQVALQDQMAGLVNDYSDFTKLMAEQTKLLDDVQAQLDKSSSTLTPYILPYEKPQDFYNRTVHSGNIGVLGLDMISSYVATSLTLPKLTQLT